MADRRHRATPCSLCLSERHLPESGLRRLVPWAIQWPVSTITAVLDADPDGTLHLPLPPDLHGTGIRIEAKLEATKPAPQAEGGLRAVMCQIRARNPFRAISDPAAWQREKREDVSLPGRQLLGQKEARNNP